MFSFIFRYEGSGKCPVSRIEGRIDSWASWAFFCFLGGGEGGERREGENVDVTVERVTDVPSMFFGVDVVAVEVRSAIFII